MNWDELRTEIDNMTPEKRAKDALFLKNVEFQCNVVKRLVTDHGLPYMTDIQLGKNDE